MIRLATIGNQKAEFWSAVPSIWKDPIWRLAYLPPNKPAKFSELIVVKRPDDGDRAFLKNVHLRNGTRVNGSLDESVPRPIKNGEVVCLVSESTDPKNASYKNMWTWNGKAKIAEDGTFVFESLPSGGVLQIIASCDGWVL